ncbi:MAG TPA: hypothetical protein VKR55_27825 [Bradyrhizobium sp.]|uniref:hypothetical protein n=1 Tax=Bradyrhizobium sp. TaxID=376 RepID=UPI002BCA1E5F|nr:hypothetical protein [Bradyrhizobium sp.]HLZ05945.1 hypothetical protein [Bradyrhizobium sp.]
MNDNSTQDRSLRGLWKWATTPPQAYVVYVLALILVWGISFLAGTLNPKRTPGPHPPPLSTQQR